jgi:hypothetical protein
MKKIRTLTDASVIELRRMQTRLNILEQQRNANSGTPDAKSVYIVRTPSGGIPKATVGTQREPGSAVCILHRRLRDSSNVDRIDTVNRDQLVYNFTDVDIPGLSYVLAYRDAWGDLWALDGSTCPDLPSPGSYPAIAGQAIAAGATGSVVYDGTVYEAVNQSQCNVVIGDKIGLHVSPGCEAFFVPCVCSCSQTTPTVCCNKFIAICINGEVEIVAVNGGSAQWTLTECCECVGTPVLTIELSCTGDTVTASWDYECGATTDSGTIDLSGLCIGSSYDDTITMGGCSVRIISTTNAEQCLRCDEGPCDDPDNCVTVECCPNPIPKTLTLTLTGGSNAGTYTMTWDGVSEWIADPAPFTGRLNCNNPTWELVLELETYGHDTAACDPFSLTFDTSSPVWDVGSVSATIS